MDLFIFLCTFLYFSTFLQMNMYSFYNTEEVAKKGDIKVYSTIFYATCHEKLLNSFLKKP